MRPRYLARWLVFVFMLGVSNRTMAQAWVPPAGVGSVSLSYQGIDNTGHFRTDGSVAERGQSLDMSVYLDVEYSVTNRLSLRAGLPFVFAKYTSQFPLTLPIPTLPVDECRCWNSGFQDFSFGARYNLITAAKGAFALTPFVFGGVPSQSYDFRGEAALGRNLNEVRIGLDAGQRLDKISPNLFVEGRYSYAFVERVIDIGTNRSNVSVEGTYVLLTRKLAVRGFATWQRTHGGLRLGSAPPSDLVFPGDLTTPERLFEHDRLLQDNNFRPGAGLSYSFPQMDIFASYVAYVSGANSHAGRAVTVGASVPFEINHGRRP